MWQSAQERPLPARPCRFRAVKANAPRTIAMQDSPPQFASSTAAGAESPAGAARAAVVIALIDRINRTIRWQFMDSSPLNGAAIYDRSHHKVFVGSLKTAENT